MTCCGTDNCYMITCCCLVEEMSKVETCKTDSVPSFGIVFLPAEQHRWANRKLFIQIRDM